MNLQEYFEFTETTKSYSNLVEYDYLTHGIWAEIGEFEGILAKRLRGDDTYKDDDYYFVVYLVYENIKQVNIVKSLFVFIVEKDILETNDI